MRPRRLLLRARIAVFRAIPPPLRTRTACAALRAASLDTDQRARLRENLRAILDPKVPRAGATG